MNRRNFFKAATGFIVGIFVTKAKSQTPFDRWLIYNYGRNNKLSPKEIGRLRSEYLKYNPLSSSCSTSSSSSNGGGSSSPSISSTSIVGLIDPTKEYFKQMDIEMPPLMQRQTDDIIIKFFA